MLVTIEKYDILKGVTYSQQFELSTECIVLEKDFLTIAIIHGDFKELSILCRDKENVDFISVRVSESTSKDFTSYFVDSVSYFDNDEIKTLIRQGEKL